MLGTNFPISEYYRKHIIDAVTLSRSGSWWTAILVISDPKTNQPFISLYRWNNRAGTWKHSSHFRIRKDGELKAVVKALGRFSEHLSQH